MNCKLLFLLAATAVAALLAGCTATRYVEAPTVREVVVHGRDSLATRDSIYVHDSTVVSLRGDTVTVERFNIVYRDRWRDRQRVDSFVQRDTVTVVKEVEKPPNAWQQARDDALLWALAVTAAFFLFIIYRYVRG